ncbi:hypothetical protein BJ322DRAFT_1144737 [Thelephora terrestris]|uniref:Uncharacterized protein n=1 Tax=Thelephora terrestris TaxID=56493 RepID=A0A9P6L3K4_9AGAM|nr:hypothetical protein BJ322DRAFT_1148535 [Thelephora terrestris]KAF9781135.1 hypothetical protein BJ322DRAFT_1144737 [Thelephora terrestris]
MSTAQLRAEARRKAILSRGTDRLSKLTSSARGEDATYISTESSITSTTVTADTFVGEDPPELPLPPHPRSVSGSAGQQRVELLNDLANTAPPDPSVWSEAQQQQFMRALGIGIGSDRGSSEPPLFSARGPSQPSQRAVSEDPNMDLLNALMAAQQQRSGTPGATTTSSDASSAFPTIPKPRSKLQKLLPLIHVISVWCLFALFAVWREPAVHSENSSWQSEENTFWARWARLSPQSSRKQGETWQVQPVPFWGALATLELVLFSFRILSGFDPISPPTILSMALPVLPPSLRSIALNGLRYFQMFGVLLDDLAAALISVGLLVYLSAWLVN